MQYPEVYRFQHEPSRHEQWPRTYVNPGLVHASRQVGKQEQASVATNNKHYKKDNPRARFGSVSGTPRVNQF